MSQALTTTDLQGALPLIARGKVRDLYEIDDKTLLFVASDRISAYDVIMENVQPPPQFNCNCDSLAITYN
jgi:phosphoribosylaminoimidazole-succinocarboxamide synthase